MVIPCRGASVQYHGRGRDGGEGGGVQGRGAWEDGGGGSLQVSLCRV